MTDRKDDRDDRGAADSAKLESFFAAGRAEKPRPDGDFLARMESAALAEQPAARPVPVAPVAHRPGFLGHIREVLGGWTGVAGLVAAGAAGIWIGVSPPDGLTVFWSVDASGLGALGVDPLGGFDLSLVEG